MKSHKIFFVVCSLVLTCLLLATPADAQKAKPTKGKPPPKPPAATCNPDLFTPFVDGFPSYSVSLRVISPGDNDPWDGMEVDDTRKTRILAWALTDGCILEWGEAETPTFVIERLETPTGYLGAWRVSPDPDVYYPEDSVVAELQDNNWDEDTVRATYEMPFILDVFRDLDGILSARFVEGMVRNDHGDGYPDLYVDGENNIRILFDIPGDLRINVNQCDLKPKKLCPTIERFMEFDFSVRLDTQ